MQIFDNDTIYNKNVYCKYRYTYCIIYIIIIIMCNSYRFKV